MVFSRFFQAHLFLFKLLSMILLWELLARQFSWNILDYLIRGKERSKWSEKDQREVEEPSVFLRVLFVVHVVFFKSLPARNWKYHASTSSPLIVIHNHYPSPMIKHLCLFSLNIIIIIIILNVAHFLSLLRMFVTWTGPLLHLFIQFINSQNMGSLKPVSNFI